MKNIFKIIALVIMMTFLGSCTKPNVIKTNTISLVDINEREKFLISTSNDKWMIYDFKVDNSYKKLKIWVEKYEFGKFIKKQGEGTTSLDNIENKQTIIFTINDIKKDNRDCERIFNIKIGDEKNNASIKFTDMVYENKKPIFVSWYDSGMKNKPIKGKMVLGSLIYSQGNSMYKLTDKFYNDVDKNIDEIRKYAVVYLFRCEFIK